MIAKKLNSNSGATIIMALLLLTVATITSAIIISSAMSAAMNVKATEKDTQAYLSVSSAAEYIKNELAKCTLTREIEIKDDSTYDFAVDENKQSAEKSAFGPEVEKLVKQIDPTKEDETYSDTFYITVANVDNTKLLPVKVKFEMNNTYDITVHLSIEDSNYSECKMKMYLYCQLQEYRKETETTETADTIEKIITIHNWQNCYISRESKV